MQLLLVISFSIFLKFVWSTPPPPSSIIIENNETIQKISRHQLEEGFMRKLNTKCTEHDNSSCIMVKWLNYMNRMLKKSSMDFGKNVAVTQTRSTDDIPSDPDDDLILSRAISSDEETLSFMIVDKIWKFLHSRALRYKLSNDNSAAIVLSTEPKGNINIGLSVNPLNAIESGRGKMKDLTPFIAVIAAKIGLVAAIAFKGLVLLVGKAMLVSKVALLLAVIIGLRKLLAQKKHVTYEVVAHPHHSESHHNHHHHHQPTLSVGHSSPGHHDTYSSGWGRTFDSFIQGFENAFPSSEHPMDSHEKAFAGQIPVNN